VLLCTPISLLHLKSMIRKWLCFIESRSSEEQQ
jgi:hypothetical protein